MPEFTEAMAIEMLVRAGAHSISVKENYPPQEPANVMFTFDDGQVAAAFAMAVKRLWQRQRV